MWFINSIARWVEDEVEVIESSRVGNFKFQRKINIKFCKTDTISKKPKSLKSNQTVNSLIWCSQNPGSFNGNPTRILINFSKFLFPIIRFMFQLNSNRVNWSLRGFVPRIFRAYSSASLKLEALLSILWNFIIWLTIKFVFDDEKDLFLTLSINQFHQNSNCMCTGTALMHVSNFVFALQFDAMWIFSGNFSIFPQSHLHALCQVDLNEIPWTMADRKIRVNIGRTQKISQTSRSGVKRAALITIK